jgi:hypothetical protein
MARADDLRQRQRRGAAAEGVSCRINEGPPPRPDPAFQLTYLGPGVAEVEGVGLFTNGTTAGVEADVAEAYRDQPEWRVSPFARGS